MSREKRMMNRRKSNDRNNKLIENRTIKEHVTKIVSNKKLLVTMILSLITLVMLLSTSLAMLMRSDSSDKKELYESGNLVIDLEDSVDQEININPAKPITDEYATKTLTPYTFTVENTGTTYASYEIYLDETITNSNKLTNEEVRKYIRYQIDDESPRSLSSQGSNIIVRGGIGPEEVLTFKLKMWISIDAPNTMENTEYKAVIKAHGKATNRMQPNGPEIVDGLIPVVYDEESDSWVKADTNTTWYNYEKQEWANAVTVYPDNRDTYLESPAGTTIDMNHINSMWVWIPRYKYRIPSNMGSTTNVINPPEIEVVFESRTNTTGVKESVYRSNIQDDGILSDMNGEKIYYTHPAFRNGNDENAYNNEPYDIGGWDKELTGMWVGKFETGTDNATCNSSSNVQDCQNVDPIIKPNVKSILQRKVSESFNISLKISNKSFDFETGEVTNLTEKNSLYGIDNSIDTHMMKNTEWGAVAYLSQSRYGKIGNKNYTNNLVQIYKNNSSYIYTGRSGGNINVEANTYGTYGYNDIKCTDSNCTSGEKTKYSGQGASTSGTIYGIYDMSGGAYEFTMGNWKSTTNNTLFNVLPKNKKYYDLYNSGESSITTTKEKAIMGDATWETLRFYSSCPRSLHVDSPWTFRGGWYASQENAGVFHSCELSYCPISYYFSFRIILVD